MHEEARRLHAQLFVDVLADQHQGGGALAALARFRFMAVLDARQLRSQALAIGTLATRLGRGLAFEFLFDRGEDNVDRFLERQMSLASERLPNPVEADPAVVGKLVRQVVYFFWDLTHNEMRFTQFS